MWIKLLSSEQSLASLMRPQFINGAWRKPAIQARQKKQLKMYFQAAGVPWIYKGSKMELAAEGDETPEVHMKSTYNKKPKGTMFRNNYETRLAMIRKNLSTMDEKMDQQRMERLKAKKPTHDEQHLLSVYKVLNSAASAGNFKQQSKSKERAAAVQADKSIGIETRKSSPVKSNRGASRGGGLSKKDRETSTISGDIVAGRSAKES